ncbi:MAG: hypothetical protein HN377_03530 [Alphaproteobacteria bacterium]|jgi:hypothetical protein|nr:hypothetical protein [Alphaproteobacteria bacterium]MBT7942787.1 hypothetical protein [Alphaproteobacteria bacterium]
MRLKTLSVAILAVGLLSGVVGLAPHYSHAAEDAPRFITVLDDLPLVSGLVEDTESGTVFDTARGRIVEVFASGALSKDDVLAFYDNTLPQLGWRRMASGVFQREGERLSLEFSFRPNSATGSAPVLTVGFRLMPSGS